MAFPAQNHDRQTASKPSKRKKSKKQSNANDDTPKAFSRLMAFAATRKLPDGLDDPKSNSNSKKRKRSQLGNNANTSSSEATAPSSNADAPASTTATAPADGKPLTLLPGEKLSEFSRRVDQAIPVSFKGLQKGEDNPKAKKKKRKATAAEDEEANPEEITEDSYDFDDNGDLLPNHLKPHNHTSTSKAGNAKGSRNSGRSKRSPSPFAELRQKRGQVQTSINDVVQAPPTLTAPKEKLRSKAVLEVPKSSGSLARREMLEQERMGIVERYRALMAKKSGDL